MRLELESTDEFVQDGRKRMRIWQTTVRSGVVLKLSVELEGSNYVDSDPAMLAALHELPVGAWRDGLDLVSFLERAAEIAASGERWPP